MITHIALIGDDLPACDVQPPHTVGGDPLVVLRLGTSLSVSVSLDQAQYIADSLLDALATSEEALNGPVPYVPMWHPV